MVRASPDRVFAHIGRVDYLPRYGAPLWMSAEPVEKRRSAHLVTLNGYLIGLPVESVLRINVRPPQAMEFKQVRGTLRALSGHCSLQGVGDATEVRYRLEADPGIPMISDEAARQFLVQFVERMLDRIKLAAERKAPTRRADRAAAAGAPALEAEEDDSEPAAEAAGSVVHEEEAAGAVLDDAQDAVVPIPLTPKPDAAAPSSGASTPAEPARPARRRRRRRHRGRGRASGTPGQGSSPGR
jgi:hypothetical protein